MGLKDFTINDASVIDSLKAFGVEEGDIVAALGCDLTDTQMYEQSTLCALSDAICVLDSNGRFFRKSYKDIEDIYAQNYVSSGAIIIKCVDDEIPVGFLPLPFRQRWRDL